MLANAKFTKLNYFCFYYFRFFSYCGKIHPHYSLYMSNQRDKDGIKDNERLMTEYGGYPILSTLNMGSYIRV